MTSEHTAAHAEDRGHHDPKEHEKHYVKVYFILVGLFLVSFVGPFVAEALPAGNVRFITILTTAFGIAFVKAFYVVRDFMHLNVEPKFVAYGCAVCLGFMLLLFAFVAPDVLNHQGHEVKVTDAQGNVIPGQEIVQWENVAAKEWVDHRMAQIKSGHAHPEYPETNPFKRAASKRNAESAPTPAKVLPPKAPAKPAAAPVEEEVAEVPPPPVDPRVLEVVARENKSQQAAFIQSRFGME